MWLATCFIRPHAPTPCAVALDHYDARGIRDPQAYAWANVYFKVNRWSDVEYGAKVRPLAAGNGHLDEARIAHLITLRDTPKRLDLMLMSKLWPGNRGPTYWHPVEHLVRIFETVAALKIRSQLRAIVPKMIAHNLPQGYRDRLSRCGVLLTETNVSASELWRTMSTARLVFFRPGRFLCMSWRMIDQLAMGACTVCDLAPYPQWPVPMTAGHQFIDCECGLGRDDSLPEQAEYARIADTIMTALAESDRTAAISRHAANYFDRHATPTHIARYILATAEQYSTPL